MASQTNVPPQSGPTGTVLNVTIRQINYATYQIGANSMEEIFQLAASINPSSNTLPPNVVNTSPLTPIDITITQVTEPDGTVLQIIAPGGTV